MYVISVCVDAFLSISYNPYLCSVIRYTAGHDQLKGTCTAFHKSEGTRASNDKLPVRILYSRRCFFSTCSELFLHNSDSSFSRRSTQALQTREFPCTSSPRAAITRLNSSRDFWSLHRLFLQVHIPRVRRPRVHSLQQYSGEPSANSQTLGSNAS